MMQRQARQTCTKPTVQLIWSLSMNSHLIVDLEVREVRDGLRPGDQLPQHLFLRRLVVKVVDEHRTAVGGQFMYDVHRNTPF